MMADGSLSASIKTAPESHRHPQTSREELTGWTPQCEHMSLLAPYLLGGKAPLPYLLSSGSSQSKSSMTSVSGYSNVGLRGSNRWFFICWSGRNAGFSATNNSPPPSHLDWSRSQRCGLDLSGNKCVCLCMCFKSIQMISQSCKHLRSVLVSFCLAVNRFPTWFSFKTSRDHHCRDVTKLPEHCLIYFFKHDYCDWS